MLLLSSRLQRKWVRELYLWYPEECITVRDTPCDEEPSQLSKIWRHPHERLDVRHCMTPACGVCFPATADVHNITALITTQ